jgi:hypothetical protein
LLKIIILFLLSFVITQILHTVFGGEKSHSETREEVIYKVTAPSGVIGCLTRDKFKEASRAYKNKNFDAVKKLLAEKICFLFEQGEELAAPSGTCSNRDGNNDLFPFSSPKLLLLRPYLPCFAVR